MLQESGKRQKFQHEHPEKLFRQCLINRGVKKEKDKLCALRLSVCGLLREEKGRGTKRQRQNEVNHTTHQPLIHHTQKGSRDTGGTSLELSQW